MTNKEFFINCWQKQTAGLVKAIHALPDDVKKLTYTHHPHFRSPWELVNHIGPHSKELCQAVNEGRIDLVNEGKFDMKAPHIYKSTGEAAKDVEETSAKLIELLKGISDEAWEKQTPIFWGPMQVFNEPLSNIGWMFYTDIIHHIGQLTSYYRTLGVEQPNLMGLTYEGEMAMMAQASAN